MVIATTPESVTGETTTTVKLFVALKFGVPLSVTMVVKVLVVAVCAGATAAAPATDATVEEYVRDALTRGLSPRDAAAEAATTFAIARRHAYELVQRVRRA